MVAIVAGLQPVRQIAFDLSYGYDLFGLSIQSSLPMRLYPIRAMAEHGWVMVWVDD